MNTRGHGASRAFAHPTFASSISGGFVDAGEALPPAMKADELFTGA